MSAQFDTHPYVCRQRRRHVPERVRGVAAEDGLARRRETRDAHRAGQADFLGTGAESLANSYARTACLLKCEGFVCVMAVCGGVAAAGG